MPLSVVNGKTIDTAFSASFNVGLESTRTGLWAKILEDNKLWFDRITNKQLDIKALISSIDIDTVKAIRDHIQTKDCSTQFKIGDDLDIIITMCTIPNFGFLDINVLLIGDRAALYLKEVD